MQDSLQACLRTHFDLWCLERLVHSLPSLIYTMR